MKSDVKKVAEENDQAMNLMMEREERSMRQKGGGNP